MPFRMILTFFLGFISLLLFQETLYAQKTIRAIHVDTPPRIDGRIVESVWSRAAKVDQFFQREPDTGAPASLKTIFYVCYDKNNLYLAAKCYDDPKLIEAQQLERDASLSHDDKIAFWFDTFLDHRNAFWFQMNARGCIGDALLNQNGASLNKQWDGLWDGRASITSDGWEVEIAIPFKTLNFHPNQDTWGIKFMREIQRRSEKSYWPEANLNSYKFQVSDAGLLVGLKDFTQGIGLDVRPYGLSGIDQKKGEDYHYPGEVGLDAFYQITPGLKSALTVNTDFAQTEVDDRQINLTRFPLFFPEKRDFFLDGAGYFQFGREGDRANTRAKRLIPFFSRRLGLDADRNPIPIVVGGKITGQTGPWNIGLLDVVDQRASSNTNFSVARISRNFGSQSMIGVIGTNGNSLDDVSNSVFGVDLRLATSTFQGNKNLSFLIYGLNSNTEDVSGNDNAFGAEVNYPNDFFAFRSGFNQIEANFTPGVGFVPRKNVRNSYLGAAVSPRPQKWGILQLQFQLDADYITDLNNKLLTREISLTPFGFRLNSGDEFGIKVGNRYEFLSGPDSISAIEVPGGIYRFWNYSTLLSTAQRRRLWGVVTYSGGGFFNGNRRTLNVKTGYKISIPLFVGLETDYTKGTLSKVDFTRSVYRVKANILFSPRTTLSNFVQYDNFSKKMGWQSRFRWILKPGNELNLVWNSISQDPWERFEISESTARVKFQYNYRF